MHLISNGQWPVRGPLFQVGIALLILNFHSYLWWTNWETLWNLFKVNKFFSVFFLDCQWNPLRYKKPDRHYFDGVWSHGVDHTTSFYLHYCGFNPVLPVQNIILFPQIFHGPFFSPWSRTCGWMISLRESRRMIVYHWATRFVGGCVFCSWQNG